MRPQFDSGSRHSTSLGMILPCTRPSTLWSVQGRDEPDQRSVHPWVSALSCRIRIKVECFFPRIEPFSGNLFSLKDKQFYTGYSTDVFRRFKEHICGYSASTQFQRPFELIYYGGHLSKKDAQRREHYFKTTNGKATLKQMLRESLSVLQNKTEMNCAGSQVA